MKVDRRLCVSPLRTLSKIVSIPVYNSLVIKDSLRKSVPKKVKKECSVEPPRIKRARKNLIEFERITVKS